MSWVSVYLSGGKLYGLNPDGSTEEVQSNFALEAESKAMQAKDKHGWKAGQDSSMFSGPSLWGVDRGRWELVRMDTQGAMTVLADGVLYYDVDAAGAVIFSNGRSLYELRNGVKKRLHKLKGIAEEVRWM